MTRVKSIALAICLGLLAIVLVPNNTMADDWRKTTRMTITQPVMIPGSVLQPGTYTLRLAESHVNRNIVEFLNEDETELVARVIAIPNERLRPTSPTAFTFWEMPAGEPRALRSWFYPGDNFGQEFAFPEEEAQRIAAANGTKVAMEVTPAKPEEPVGPPVETTPVEPEEEPLAQAIPPAEPEPTPPAAEPPPPAEPPPAEPAPALPVTSTPLPLIALAGLLSLGAAVAVRVASR